MDLKLIKQYREKLGLRKNDENDAVVLSTLPIEAFKELRLAELEIRKLLLEHEFFSKIRRRVKVWNSRYSGQYLQYLESELDDKCDELAKRIVEMARSTMWFYRLVEERLGLKGVSIVNLLLHVDFSRTIQQIKSFLLKNRKVKGVLSRYALSLYLNAKQNAGINDEYKKLAQLSKKEAIKKIMVNYQGYSATLAGMSSSGGWVYAGPVAWEKAGSGVDPRWIPQGTYKPRPCRTQSPKRRLA